MTTLIEFGKWNEKGGVEDIHVEGNLIKCHTSNTPFVLNKFKTTVVIVSEGGDLGIARDKNQFKISGSHSVTVKTFKDIPNNIGRWYCTNADLRHGVVRCLPLGINSGTVQNCLERIRNPVEKTGLLYMNFQVDTNPHSRDFVRKFFRRLDWVTNDMEAKLPQEDYLKSLQAHKYALCPAGNGVDTYRFWECIYLKTIPIVLRNKWSENFANLPVLIVDNWIDVKKETLEDEDVYLSQMCKPTYMAYREYWDEQIRESVKRSQ